MRLFETSRSIAAGSQHNKIPHLVGRELGTDLILVVLPFIRNGIVVLEDFCKLFHYIRANGMKPHSVRKAVRETDVWTTLNGTIL